MMLNPIVVYRYMSHSIRLLITIVYPTAGLLIFTVFTTVIVMRKPKGL
jgi:hypothetical protein